MSIKKFDEVLVYESGQAIVVTGKVAFTYTGGLPTRGEASASEHTPGKWWVNRVLINPETLRGHGLGTELLHKLLETLSAKDTFKQLLVQPGGYNLPVSRQRKFYKKSGFKPVRKSPGVLRWTKREMSYVKTSVG